MELGDNSSRRASSRRPMPRASRIARRRGPSAAGTSPAFSTGSFSSIQPRLQATRCSDSTSTDLAVDQRTGDDQQPLEDVLPFLIEAQKHSRIQDLDAEDSSHEGSDEGAASPKQTGSSENHGGDRRQGVARSLTGVSNAQLCEQDNRPEKREERGAYVSDQRRACRQHTDSASGLLVRSDGPQPHPELRSAKCVLERDRDRDEDDERDGDRADL